MADLGDVLGTFMTALVRARRMADEQTAALAELYRANPLLEGLSVPRIRVPELTIEMPLLVEDSRPGKPGKMADPAKIAAAAEGVLKETLAARGLKPNPALLKGFSEGSRGRLAGLSGAGGPPVKESVIRAVQDAFSEAVPRGGEMPAADRDAVLRALRSRIAAVAFEQEPEMPGIGAIVRTADVKEQATAASAVRVKITLREEGLEWATQAGESGGVVRTLTPE